MEKGRLDGWKEISEYLKRDIRTCQRWEKHIGLPVHRIDRFSFRSKVFAYKSEIDHWLETFYTEKVAEKKIFLRKTWNIPIFLLAIFITAFLIFSFFLLKKKGIDQPPSLSELNPARWTLKGQYLAFYDLKDRYLWGVKVDNPKNQKDYYFDEELRDEKGKLFLELSRNRIDFSDIDKDGRNEVLCYLNHRNPRERCIALFDNDGHKLWSQSIEFNQGYEGGRIVNDYIIQQLEFEDINNDGEEEILALWRHIRRFPSIFTIYDQKGKELLKYCNTGILQIFIVCTFNKGHKEIFLGGTNNILNGDAILAVLDCHQLRSGLAPPYKIPPDLEKKENELWIYIPKNYRPACQKYYVRFKHNELCKILGVKWLNIMEVHAGKNEINIQVVLDIIRGCALYFSFDGKFNLRYVRPSADLERDYEKYFKEGIINIPLKTFLKKCENDVLFWNGEGWGEKPVVSE